MVIMYIKVKLMPHRKGEWDWESAFSLSLFLKVGKKIWSKYGIKTWQSDGTYTCTCHLILCISCLLELFHHIRTPCFAYFKDIDRYDHLFLGAPKAGRASVLMITWQRKRWGWAGSGGYRAYCLRAQSPPHQIAMLTTLIQ